MPNLLIPIDADELFLHAVLFASKLRGEGNPLTLLHVIRPFQSQQVSRFIGRQQLEQYQREDAEAALAPLLAQLQEQDIPYTLHYEFGVPGEVIAKHAAQYDLVVMGTHGHGPLSGFFLGSVSNAVLKAVQRPVILVPKHANIDAPRNKIVLAVDGSAGSHHAAAAARQLATETGASCEVLHVVAPPINYSSRWEELDLLDQQTLLGYGEEILEAYTEAFEQSQIAYAKKVVIGFPASSILETAKAEEAFLIALGYDGMNALAQSVLGSVAFKVIQQSGVPLLVVK